MSYGEDFSYRSIGVLRTGASDIIAPDTRGMFFPYVLSFIRCQAEKHHHMY
jgi:hypothetical protein